MDPRRFDSLAKRLGTRLSRRDALRAGAGAALGAVTLVEIAPSLAQDPETTVKDRFTSIRTYPYTGPISAAQAGLKDLVTLMEQQAGFISIDLVHGSEVIHIIATFLDRSSAVAAAAEEDAWIADHAQAILSDGPDIHSGDVLLRSELHAGCRCTTGTDDACNSSRLVCCGTTAQPGGPGVCLTTATPCPAVEGAIPVATPTELPTAAPTPAPTDTPTQVPTAEPTEIPACTSEGCDCIIGDDNECDDDLECCGVGDTGDPGLCQFACG